VRQGAEVQGREWLWTKASVGPERMLAALATASRRHIANAFSRHIGCSPFVSLCRRANPDEETTDWRAVCGRIARTVRRAGTARAVPDPYRAYVYLDLMTNADTIKRLSKPSNGRRVQPGFRSCDRQKARGATLPQQVDGFLPLSRHQSPVLGENAKAHGNDVPEHKMTLQLHSRTPSLLQGSASLSANSV